MTAAGRSGRDPRGGWSTALDYLELTKPEITGLVVFTAFTGYLYATHRSLPTPGRLAGAMAGVALASAGSAALNMVRERRDDARMRRTRNRPVAAGRIPAARAAWFGALTALAGFGTLAAAAGPVAAVLAVATSALYLFGYTPLKRRSHACLLVGAAAGALPPVVGWVAGAGSLAWPAVILFAIQFCWQLPHFLAIAWLTRADYALVGWRMLPDADPTGVKAGRSVLLWGLALLGVSVALPAYVSTTGQPYLLGAVVLGFLFLLFQFRFAVERTDETARRLFGASIVYLPALFLLLALDQRLF